MWYVQPSIPGVKLIEALVFLWESLPPLSESVHRYCVVYTETKTNAAYNNDCTLILLLTLMALVLISEELSLNRAMRYGSAPASSTAYLPLVITPILGGHTCM